MGTSADLARRLPRARIESKPTKRITGLDKGAICKEQRTKHKTSVRKQPLVRTYFNTIRDDAQTVAHRTGGATDDDAASTTTN
jgi:hypothetical protein